MTDILKDDDFIKLEKEFKFLSRARSRHGELEKLSFIIVDLETTGLDPNTDEIIEIGAIRIDNGEIKDIFNKLVRPERHITQMRQRHLEHLWLAEGISGDGHTL